MRSDPDPAIGPRPVRVRDDGTPRWVKIFSIGAVAAVAAFAALHLAGGGMGPDRHMSHGGSMGHLMHDGMDAPVPPTDSSQHQP